MPAGTTVFAGSARQRLFAQGSVGGEAVELASATGLGQRFLTATAGSMRGVPGRVPATVAIMVTDLCAAFTAAGPVTPGVIFFVARERWRSICLGAG